MPDASGWKRLLCGDRLADGATMTWDIHRPRSQKQRVKDGRPSLAPFHSWRACSGAWRARAIALMLSKRPAR